jgi:hypothetical protein
MTIDNTPAFSRRALMFGAPLLLAGCAGRPAERVDDPFAAISPDTLATYGARPEERFPLPAIDLTRVDPTYLHRLRQPPSWSADSLPC